MNMYKYKICYRIAGIFQIAVTQFTVTRLQPTGIYFQNINDLKLSNAHWRLITYVDIADYNKKYDQINNIMEKMIKSCDLGLRLGKDSINSSCFQFRNQALSFLSEINNNRNHVLRVIDSPSIENARRKRGLINAIGRVANILFGVCDDSDAEYFYNKIRELDSNKVRSSQIIETQTNIMKSIVSVTNNSLIENERNQESLAKSYNYLLKENEAQKFELGIMKFETEIVEKITIFNLIINQFAYETDNLVNIINSALQGFIHSSLIDTKILMEQLKEIKINIPVDLELPVEISYTGISELLHLATISIIYVNNVLTYIIEIPLINNFKFVLYKPIPLPAKLTNDVYVIIEPCSEYIAIEKSRLHYIKFSSHQLSLCKKSKKAIICFHDQPIQSSKESCEIMLFRDSETVPKTCKIKYFKLNFNIWHKLENTNTWLYAVINDNILITCKNTTEPISIRLNGTGTLKLESYCEANTNDEEIKLIPNKKIVSKVMLNYSPRLNISMNFESWENFINEDTKNSQSVNQNIEIKHDLNKLTEISKTIDTLSNSFKKPEESTDSLSKYKYVTICIIIICVGLSILLSLLYFRIKKSCNKPIEDKIDSKNCTEVELESLERPIPKII